MWTEAEQLPRVGKRPAVSSSQNYCSPKCAPPVHKSPINVDVSMAQILSWDVKQKSSLGLGSRRGFFA